MKTTGFVAVMLGGLALTGGALAQQVISAKSGLINYVEGQAFLDGKPVEVKIGNFPSVSKQSEFRTTDGRAEILLGPGVFLRIGEDSAFKMTGDRITDTRLEFLSGSAIAECAALEKDEAVTITYKDATISLLKNGLYRVDSEPARLMVYDGEARVAQAGQMQTVGRSRLLLLNGVAIAEKFDSKTGDALYRWARRRSENLSVANISAARSVGRYADSYVGSYGPANSWIWNPYFGTYTFVPLNGIYSSFWGYQFFSPYSVYNDYVPPRVYARGGGSSKSDPIYKTPGAPSASQAPGARSVNSARSGASMGPHSGGMGRSSGPAVVSTGSPRATAGSAGGRTR